MTDIKTTTLTVKRITATNITLNIIFTTAIIYITFATNATNLVIIISHVVYN